MGSIFGGTELRASQLNMSLCRYLSTDTTSTVATGATELVLTYATAQSTTPDVSVLNNKTFTLNKSGIWFIEFSTRVGFTVGPTTGDMFAYAYTVDGVIQFCGETVSEPITNAPLAQARTTRSFNAGDRIETRMRNSTNQVLTISAAGELARISLVWLQAL